MDPKLAEIYGTNQPTEADLEKLAAAELAEGLANDDQIDMDGLSEEDLEAVAQDVLGSYEDTSEEQTDGDEADEGQEKTSEAEEAKEKLAEADYLGRVMAHAYVNELREIEKVADGIADQGVATKQTKMEKAREMGREALGKAKGLAKREGQRLSRAATDVGAATRGAFGGAFGKAMESGGQHLSGKQRLQMLGSAAKGFAPAAATVGGLAAAGYGAKKLMGKKKEKRSSAEEMELSAVDTLVLARANEILEQSGIDPDGLEKQSFALTDEGHKLDAKRYAAIAKAHHEASKAEDEYASEAPVKASLFRPGMGALHRMHGRHADYAAAKHEKGQNALNPFGGLGGKSRQEKEKKSADGEFDPREFLAAEVEQRAWNLLGEYGVVPAEQEDEQGGEE